MMVPTKPTVVKKNRLFFFLVCFSILSGFGGLLNTILDSSTFGESLYFQSLGVLLFGIFAIKEKYFFFEGNLTLNCSPWLVMATIQIVYLAILVFFVDYPSGLESRAVFYGSICGFNALFDIVVFFCYRYWSFFRPYKVVPYVPAHVAQAQQLFAQATPPVQEPVQMNV